MTEENKEAKEEPLTKAQEALFILGSHILDLTQYYGADKARDAQKAMNIYFEKIIVDASPSPNDPFEGIGEELGKSPLRKTKGVKGEEM